MTQILHPKWRSQRDCRRSESTSSGADPFPLLPLSRLSVLAQYWHDFSVANSKSDCLRGESRKSSLPATCSLRSPRMRRVRPAWRRALRARSRADARAGRARPRPWRPRPRRTVRTSARRRARAARSRTPLPRRSRFSPGRGPPRGRPPGRTRAPAGWRSRATPPSAPARACRREAPRAPPRPSRTPTPPRPGSHPRRRQHTRASGC